MSTRILALVSDCYGAGGGIARYNQDLFEALTEGGAEIVILPRLGELGGNVLPPGIRQLPAVLSRPLFSLVALWTAWRLRPIDIVFCGHPFMAPVAWMVARFARARYWLQAHGTDIWGERPVIVRKAIEAADMATAVSRATRHSLLGWVDLAPDRAHVLPDTVRDMFVPGPRSEALAARLKLGPGPILLTVGRLAASERYKGHDQIFAALPAVLAKFPTLVHAIAGDGDDRARLEQAARDVVGHPTAVRFLGFVPDEDLLDLYRLADLYVMPSTQEGFGIVYLEAAACGLRVVGGKGGGSGDAIPDGRVGVTVDPDDTAALADAIMGQLGQGRVDPAAVEPYRRTHFAPAARLLLARLLARPRRMKGES